MINTLFNNADYCWQRSEDYLKKFNYRLNDLSDRFAEQKVIPTIEAAYQKVGQIAPRYLDRFPSIQKWAAQNWYDPFSISFISRITKVVERISHWVATNKPSIEGVPSLPGYFHYLDTCLISGAQHLHRLVKEANYLLTLPKTLRNYTESLSFDRFITNLSNFFGRSWVVVGKIILAAKYITLKVLNCILKTIEVALTFFTLGSMYFLIVYLRETIVASSKRLQSKFTDIAHRAISKREDAIRKELTVKIAKEVTNTVVTTVNRAALKSLIGGAVFLGAKFALQSSLNISPQTINFLGAVTVGVILWKNLLKPTWDPYYKAYDKDYDPKASFLKQFCDKYSFSHLYAPLKTIQTYTKET